MVKMDPENDYIESASGFKLLIDTSYEPEKHIVRTGTVTSLPTHLTWKDGNPNFPWKTKVELKIGDQVVMYFLAVQNCLSKERKNFFKDKNDVWIFIKYHNIYAAIRDGNIIPINGYVLVEPMEDPAFTSLVARGKKNDIWIPDTREQSKVDVVFGKVAFTGEKLEKYNSPYKSDEHCNIQVGDEIVMKRIRDIPVEYEYHAKLDGGRKLYRMQRHDILAIL